MKRVLIRGLIKSWITYKDREGDRHQTWTFSESDMVALLKRDGCEILDITSSWLGFE